MWLSLLISAVVVTHVSTIFVFFLPLVAVMTGVATNVILFIIPLLLAFATRSPGNW